MLQIHCTSYSLSILYIRAILTSVVKQDVESTLCNIYQQVQPYGRTRSICGEASKWNYWHMAGPGATSDSPKGTLDQLQRESQRTWIKSHNGTPIDYAECDLVPHGPGFLLRRRHDHHPVTWSLSYTVRADRARVPTRVRGI